MDTEAKRGGSKKFDVKINKSSYSLEDVKN